MRDFEPRIRMKRGTVAEEYPEVAAMWHPTANGFTPSDITAGSNQRAALICPVCGYGSDGEWQPTVASACRTKGGCPVCSGKIVVKGKNDVATVHPEIAEQWHPTLNKISPDEVSSGSGKHVFLVCKNCGYGKKGEWCPVIAFACGSGDNHTDCPACAAKAQSERLKAYHERRRKGR